MLFLCFCLVFCFSLVCLVSSRSVDVDVAFFLVGLYRLARFFCFVLFFSGWLSFGGCCFVLFVYVCVCVL